MPVDSLIDAQDPSAMRYSPDSTGSAATPSDEDSISMQTRAARRVMDMRDLRAEVNPETYLRGPLRPVYERFFAPDPQLSSAPIRSMEDTQSSAIRGDPPHDLRRCGNCDRVGHDLSICVGPPGFDGALHGCPCCNTTAHLFDNCPRASLMDDNLKYHYLVLLRGRRAPISTRQDYLGMAASRGPSEFYPWTRAYARGVSPSVFTSHDYVGNDPRALPADPATANKAALLRTLDRILELPVTAQQLEYFINV
ncbi:hypothetical protein F5Y00DRAFT_215105 [Daldinia vernicosa]|uniref:uncharacterized protein n=1 Tax=Daldinia vernicosa TaxID=114800 RepID=UPI0020081D31|nr:uncharacterized protein F5Y00DRAFT_215105 [Daldinia vernicosa]KAI0851680.1 hypothetical protein F5Y00DRAFT_215105 [Daldinia vernicosa]